MSFQINITVSMHQLWQSSTDWVESPTWGQRWINKQQTVRAAQADPAACPSQSKSPSAEKKLE